MMRKKQILIGSDASVFHAQEVERQSSNLPLKNTDPACLYFS